MNSTHRSNRKLTILPLVWVVVAGIGGIGLYERLTDDPPSNTLEYLHKDKTVVVRLSEPSFDFPVLDARVTPSPDWVYLSTTNPALAEQPTFVNAALQCVLVLRPAMATSTGSDTEIMGSLTFAKQKFDGMEIEWMRVESPVRVINTSVDGIGLSHRWTEWTPSRLGMLSSGKLKLILLAYGAPAASGTGDYPGLDLAIEGFCRGISRLSAE